MFVTRKASDKRPPLEWVGLSPGAPKRQMDSLGGGGGYPSQDLGVGVLEMQG